MEMNVHHDKKTVDIWLTRSEARNDNFRKSLEPYYQQFKDKVGVDVHIISEALGFYLGNVFRYIARAGYKSEQGYSQNQKKLEDLYKAKEYLDFEINKIKKENNNE